MGLMKKEETEAHVSLPLQVTEAASGKDGLNLIDLRVSIFQLRLPLLPKGSRGG